MREYDLPGGARAHTVTAAEDGTMWYTGNGNGTMGSLDPETGDRVVFVILILRGRDVSAAFDQADLEHCTQRSFNGGS